MFGSKTDTDNTVAKSAYDAKVTELSFATNEVASLKAEVASLKLRLARSTNSVNARVNETLATIGVSQFAVETIYNSQTGETPEAITRKFNSLPVEAKREYYNKHKDVITNATAGSDVPSVKTS